jgi:hypothetical protein
MELGSLEVELLKCRKMLAAHRILSEANRW